MPARLSSFCNATRPVGPTGEDREVDAYRRAPLYRFFPPSFFHAPLNSLSLSDPISLSFFLLPSRFLSHRSHCAHRDTVPPNWALRSLPTPSCNPPTPPASLPPAPSVTAQPLRQNGPSSSVSAGSIPRKRRQLLQKTGAARRIIILLYCHRAPPPPPPLLFLPFSLSPFFPHPRCKRNYAGKLAHNP